MKHVLSALCVLALALDVDADGCRRVSYAPTYHTPTTYVAPTYVTPTYTTSYLQVAAPVFPLYGVGYGNDEAKLLREEFLQFRRELLARDAAHAGAPAPPAPTPPQPQVLPPAAPPGLKAHRIQDKTFNAYVRANCASCHGSAPKGNKFQLMIDGNDTLIDNGPLNAQIFVRMALPDTHPKHMPKSGKPASNDMLDMAAELALSP